MPAKDEDVKALLPHGSLHGSNSYTLYRRRWFMLAVVVMFNISNAIIFVTPQFITVAFSLMIVAFSKIWITFAPVTNYSASYFDISEKTVNYFSLIFFITFAPCCGISWWMIEKLGFRFSVIFGSSINAVGAVIRIIGAVACSDVKTKFIVVFIGQMLAACTQPLVLSMPTKLAALWFGEHERTVANTIGSMSNPLGVLIANALATVIVSKSENVETMIVIFGFPAIIAALMAIFGFWSSKPPTPPSASAMTEPVSFFTGIKQVFRSKSFLLLSLTTGSGIAVFSTLTTILQQLICPKGYSDTIAAVCGALVIVGGFIGAGITGVYIDKTRQYIPVAKIIGMLVVLSCASVIVSSSLKSQPVFLALSFTLLGFSALGLLPVMLELGVECVYPVDEATSSGMQWMIGQLIGVVMMVGGLAAAPSLTPDQVKQSSCLVEGGAKLNPVDLSYPTIVMVLVVSVLVIVFVMFFDTPYHRLNAEEKLNHDTDRINTENLVT